MIRFLGPKSSQFLFVISCGGTIFFAFLGIAYLMKSPALREDLTVKYPNTEGKDHAATELARKTAVFQAYTDTGINCILTSVLYILTALFSIWQVRENKKADPYRVN